MTDDTTGKPQEGRRRTPSDVPGPSGTRTPSEPGTPPRTVTPSGTRRQDNEFILSLAFRRQIWDNITGVVAYLGNFNESNDPVFEYNRNVVSVGLEARY